MVLFKNRFRGDIHEKLEYLRENECLRQTILACLSGAQMGSIYEKKIKVENLVTLPL